MTDLDVVFRLLWQLDIETRKRYLELERTLSEVTQDKATIYSITLLEDLSTITHSDPDQEMESITGRIIVLFQEVTKTYSDELIQQLKTSIWTDITKHSDCLVRDLLCVYGENFVKYAPEVMSGFKREMTDYVDNQVENAVVTFSKEIGEFSNDFEAAIELVSTEIEQLQSMVATDENTLDKQYNNNSELECHLHKREEDSVRLEEYLDKEECYTDQENLPYMRKVDTGLDDSLDKTDETVLEDIASDLPESSMSKNIEVDVLQKRDIPTRKVAAKNGKTNILKKMWHTIKRLFSCKSG